MRILMVNLTQFHDDDLRAIVRAACVKAGVAARTITLRVNPGRLHVRGRATVAPKRSQLLCGSFTLQIPPFESWDPRRHGKRERTIQEWVTEICQVALHEAMHLAGVRHQDMTEEQLYCKMPVPWSAGMQLRDKEVRPELPREERLAAARGDRLKHAERMLSKARTRLKRAATIEKKWRRRVGVLSR